MISLENAVNTTIKRWNENCKSLGINQEYFIDIKCRNKKFYLNRNDFYEKYIAEMTLYTKGDVTLLLWRKQIIMPDKVKGVPKHIVENEYKDELYEYLMYEAIGNFCVTTKALITNRDYAEYDIEKDQLKPDASANGMVLQTTKKGPFFEPGQDFDVFMCTDDYYLVYTCHDIATPTNGIAKMQKDECFVKEMAKPSIILLKDLKD